MKKLETLILLCLIFFAGGCCTDEGCPLNSNDIIIRNFDSSDRAVVLLYEYEKLNNFVTPIDSLWLDVGHDIYNDNYILYQSIKDIDENYYYRIYFKNPKLNYFITDITTARKSCNKCFPFGSLQGSAPARTAYHINGKLVNNPNFEIEK